MTSKRREFEQLNEFAQEPNQFALALTDGGVVVIEPLESTGKWGEAPSVDSISFSSRSFSGL